MKCPRCGAENHDGALRCTTCGTVLPKTGPFSAVLHALFYVFVFFACQYFVTAGYMTSLMMGSLSGGAFDEAALMTVMDQVVAQAVMISLISNLLTVLVLCLIQTLRRRNPVKEFNLRPVNLFRCPTFVLFGVSLNVVVSGTLSFLPLPESILEAFETQYASLYGNTSPVIEILSIAVVTGITEEIVFRGLVNSRLARGLKRGTVMIVSSLIFGLAHGALIAVVYSALLGLVFCVMYEKFHSVIPSILCHVAFNGTSYLLAALDERWLLPLYLFSLAAMLFCAYRIFFRRPTFYDYVLDTVGEHRLRDNAEREIINEVRRLQEDGDISPEDIDRLAEAWEENDKKYRRNSSAGANNTDSNDNNTKET